MTVPPFVAVILLRCKQCGQPMGRLAVFGENVTSADEVIEHAYWTARATRNRRCECGRARPEPGELAEQIRRWFARGVFVEPGGKRGDMTVRW